MNSDLDALIAEDSELATTIANILENDETGYQFKASFEFANGTLSDSTTADAAKAKINGVKAKLMGGYNEETGQLEDGIIDAFRSQLEEVGGEYDEKFMQMLSRGFSIRVSSSGDIEILGAEGLSGVLQDTLKGLVRKALDEWANDSAGDTSGNGDKLASFSDVVETFVEQHRFEHGDVDEYEHLLEINFSGSASDAKVVSPAADAAQDEANQEVAGKLGDKLRTMLTDNGVEAEGLEFEIDETGKITVLGNPEDFNVKKAQSLVDQFVEEAKGAGGKIANGDPEEKEELARERGRIRNGEKDGNEDGAASASVGFGKRDVVATSEKTEEEKWLQTREELTEKIRPFLPDPEMKDPESIRMREKYIGWNQAFSKYKQDAHFISNVAPVSSVRPRKYASLQSADAAGEVNPFGMREDDLYADDATGLYLELMDGMTQFHDGRRKVNYTF